MTGAPQNGQMAKSCMMAVSATSQRTRTGEIKGAVCASAEIPPKGAHPAATRKVSSMRWAQNVLRLLSPFRFE